MLGMGASRNTTFGDEASDQMQGRGFERMCGFVTSVQNHVLRTEGEQTEEAALLPGIHH